MQVKHKPCNMQYDSNNFEQNYNLVKKITENKKNYFLSAGRTIYTIQKMEWGGGKKNPNASHIPFYIFSENAGIFG